VEISDIEGGGLRAPEADLQANRKNGAVAQPGDGVGVNLGIQADGSQLDPNIDSQ
jgi:hypothetical protein